MEPGSERPRIVALLPFSNESRYLPGWFENVGDHIDAVVALDDGSTDGGAEYIAAQPLTVTLIRNQPSHDRLWDEPENRRRLLREGRALGADWFIAMDVDERFSDAFWRDLNLLLRTASDVGSDVLEVHWRELWDSPMTFRADGIWARKAKAIVFKNVADLEVDPRAWHGEWFPESWVGTPRVHRVPYDLFHLRMIDAGDRILRRERYVRLDPGRVYQPIGYDYLTNEEGLLLQTLTPEQAYRGVPV